LTRLSEALACNGPLTVESEKTLNAVLSSQLLEQTTIAVADPGAINGAFSRDEVRREFAAFCASVTDFRVMLSHLAVDASEPTASARADVTVQYRYLGRAQNEHRLARFTLNLQGNGFRVASVEIGPNVVNQPEPRP
jgi:hypothetical protein